jgi:hypothetical protein
MADAMVPSNVPKQNMKVGRIDSISDVPYRIGYSFRNPAILKPVTRTRERPYFSMDWAIKGPAQVKEELYKSGVLQRFPSTWRRSAKAMNVSGLGVVGNRRELPDFNELGAAPGPTDKETVNSSTTRDFLGFLQNSIKDVGAAIGQSQQLEILRAQAQGPYATRMPISYMPTSDGIGALGWAAIIGAIGIGTFMYVRR